jgi:hypothetical protein
MQNLAGEVEYAKIKEKLSQQLSKWMISQNDLGMASEMNVPLKARDMSKVPKE